jgi:Protein of unknown function (DUF1569)
MQNLDDLLNELKTKVPDYETINQKISQTAVWWHIEHSLLTLNRITDNLLHSNPAEYKWKFNFIRMAVLAMKKIPRGKAKSPEVVQPKGNIDKNYLLAHISETGSKIKELKTLSKDNYFEHPFFGKLKLQQAINFLEIHTKHHLEIINDIIKKQRETNR